MLCFLFTYVHIHQLDFCYVLSDVKYIQWVHSFKYRKSTCFSLNRFQFSVEILYLFFFKSSPEYVLIDFSRQRRRERREKERWKRRTSISCLLYVTPPLGPSLRSFGEGNGAPTNWPTWPGQIIYLFIHPFCPFFFYFVLNMYNSYFQGPSLTELTSVYFVVLSFFLCICSFLLQFIFF